MNYLLAQVVNKKQLVPTLVHDDFTRILISIIGLLFSSIILYRLMKYYDG